MGDVRELTADYEAWLGSQITLDPAELRRKHDELAHDEYRFLRGTYYLWQIRDLAPDVVRIRPEGLGHHDARERVPRARVDHDRRRTGGLRALAPIAHRPLAAGLVVVGAPG